MTDMAKKATSKWALVAMFAAVALVAAACTSTPASTEETTTTVAAQDASSDDPLVFGRGEIPSTVPTDFPFPEQAVVGTTMIDRTRSLTELIITYPAVVEAVVQFYEQNLPVLGYTVDSSEGSDGEWLLVFSKDGSTGEVILETGGAGVAAGTLRFISS